MRRVESLSSYRFAVLFFGMALLSRSVWAQTLLSAIPFDSVPGATVFFSSEISLQGAVCIDSMVPQSDSLRIVDGDILFDSAFDSAIKMRNSSLVDSPLFSLGRLVATGGGDARFRVFYSDDSSLERPILQLDSSGLLASVRQEVGIHFEGFIESASEPLVRLSSSPSAQLELGGGGSAAPDVSLSRVGANVLAIFTNGQERLRVDPQGQVGIGTMIPTTPLQMASGAHVTAGGVWMNASSRQYKKDVHGLSGSEALQAILGLSPVLFEYSAEPGERYVGFIAEDVPELFAHGNRDALSSMDLIAALVKVVQQQQDEIQGLKDQMAALKEVVEGGEP